MEISFLLKLGDVELPLILLSLAYLVVHGLHRLGGQIWVGVLKVINFLWLNFEGLLITQLL